MATGIPSVERRSAQPPGQQGTRLNACSSSFDTLAWLNMTINHYHNVYRSYNSKKHNRCSLKIILKYTNVIVIYDSSTDVDFM